MKQNARFGSERAEVRAIHFAPLGLHTRYMLAAYLRHVLVVAVGLLTIALTIDLWPQIQMVTEGDSALPAIWHVVRLAALRTPDLLPSFLPFSTFLGVVWAEVVFTQSSERMLIWNSGRSPVQCLAPVVALGLILGVTEFVTDAYMRPAAIATQIRERLGREGKRLDRTLITRSHWIALPDGLVRAEVEFGPPALLHNLTVYKLDADGHLSEVDTASAARPITGTDRWLLTNGSFWTASAEASSAGPARMTFTIGSPTGETQIPFAQRSVTMKLNPLWISNIGMSPQYLPIPVLRALARDERGPLADGDFRTRVQVLYAETLLPGMMAIFASLLSMLVFTYSIPPRALVGTLFAGYLAHFATKACQLMGAHGYMNPVVAGWLVPFGLFVCAVVILHIVERRRGADGRQGTVRSPLAEAAGDASTPDDGAFETIAEVR